MAVTAILFLAALALVQPARLDLGGGTLSTSLDRPEQTATVGPFLLPRPYNRVIVRAWGNGLDNQWIDADLSLVDQKSQRSYDAYALTEHYSGYDSDGAWSEGEPEKDVVFSHIPAGRYDLVVDYSAHTWSTYTQPASWTASTGSNSSTPSDRPSPPLGLDLQVGGVEGWNFGLALVAILIPPAAVTYAQYKFDRRRRGLA
jgi:hypothetical protein